MKIILEKGVAPVGTGPERQIAVDRPMTLRALLAELSKTVPLIERLTATADETGQRPSLLILRNGAWLAEDDFLEDGDVVEIHPPTAGG